MFTNTFTLIGQTFWISIGVVNYVTENVCPKLAFSERAVRSLLFVCCWCVGVVVVVVDVCVCACMAATASATQQRAMSLGLLVVGYVAETLAK